MLAFLLRWKKNRGLTILITFFWYNLFLDFLNLEIDEEEDIINLFDYYVDEDEFEIVEINKY